MRVLPLVAVGTLIASVAIAQNLPAQNGPQNPAMKSVNENVSSKPVMGANSFTMGQAKAAIEARGYTRISSLKKDTEGVWRGRAMKNGHTTPVSVDYQGNVN
jgi:hypothetical protein